MFATELPTGQFFPAWPGLPPGLALLRLPAGQAKNKRLACGLAWPGLQAPAG